MAEARVFYYDTDVHWQTDKEGQLKGTHLPSVSIGAPPEFKGREGNWTPEHLFVGSVATCFMLTLLAIAENSRLTLVSYASSARGKLEKVPGAGYEITEITIKPRVVVAAAEDLQRITRILEKAKENCFITNSIKSRVLVEPEVFHQQTARFPCPPEQA